MTGVKIQQYTKKKKIKHIYIGAVCNNAKKIFKTQIRGTVGLESVQWSQSIRDDHVVLLSLIIFMHRRRFQMMAEVCVFVCMYVCVCE